LWWRGGLRLGLLLGLGELDCIVLKLLQDGVVQVVEAVVVEIVHIDQLSRGSSSIMPLKKSLVNAEPFTFHRW
jgi:hypothetical protein